MKHKVKVLAALFSFFIVFSAYGEEMPNDDGTLDFNTASLFVLGTADLSKIETVHCVAFAEDKTNAQAAFGCFIAKLLKYLESEPVDNLLADFGEPALNIHADIFDKDNPDALCAKVGGQGSSKYWKQFPKLPFNELDLEDMTFTQAFKELVKKLNANGTSLTQLQKHLYALDNSDLTELTALLDSARSASNFSFTIPKEMCQVSKDIFVKKIDLEGIYAAIGSLKVATNILYSYYLGLDLKTFANADGSIDTVKFKNDANGGADKRIFATLKYNKANASSLKKTVVETLKSIIALTNSISSKDDSDVFGELFEKYPSFFQKLNKASKDLKASLDYVGRGLTPFTNLGYPDVKIGMNQFLAKLPDPASVKNADPFVVSKWGELQAVSAFFETLLTGIASF